MEGCDWSKVEEAAASMADKKWISNEKQKIKRNNEPLGHEFEAVAHFKQYTQTRDPFYIYKLRYGTGTNSDERNSFVF